MAGHSTRRRLAATARTAVAGASFMLAIGAGAAADHGHDAHAEPVPTGAELAARCSEYREQLTFTRAQLKARNFLGRSDLFRSEHRKREQFVAANCGDSGHGARGAGGDHATHDGAHHEGARDAGRHG